MGTNRSKLSDILGDSGGNFRNTWRGTAAADDFGPLPPGEYTFRIVAGELFKSRGGTPGYKWTLEVAEGEYEGRRAWHDLWLSPAALPMTKRDLAKIEITDPEQLERPLPSGILVKGRVAIRRDDDGNERNRLLRFEFLGIEKGDAFEPSKDDEGDDNPLTTTRPTEADEAVIKVDPPTASDFDQYTTQKGGNKK